MKTVIKDELIEILKECYTKADLCRVLDLLIQLKLKSKKLFGLSQINKIIIPLQFSNIYKLMTFSPLFNKIYEG